MNTFLTKISQLPTIQEVLLLSPRGELLFSNTKKGSGEVYDNVSLWNAIIEGLNSPVEATLFFEKGGYYLHFTGIGYVVVVMNGFTRLQNLKTACANLQAKLSDSTICKKVLLRMLREADEAVKPQIVTALLPFADNEIAGNLIPLLEKEAASGPKSRLKMLVNICQVLGQCSSPAARDALKKLLKEHYSGQMTLENEARYATQVALAQLELALPPESKTPTLTENHLKKVLPEAPHVVSIPTPPEKGYAAQMPEGRRIQELLNKSRKGEAIALMLEQIQLCAGKKQFDMAEQLREWLIQVDSLSLREIIRAAEIIDDEKKASISNEHLAVWTRLVNTLSMEDYSSLYYATVRKNYHNGEIVVQQGEFVSTLFFVNKGRVQLFSANNGGEYVLKVVEAGEIFGVETFFDISIWTMSARSLGADLSLLTWERLLKLKESNPALQAKLIDFCSQFKVTTGAFKKASNSRRRLERVNVSGKVVASLQNKAGKQSLGIKGVLLDISRGGMAFGVRFSNKKNAIALLQQDLEMTVRTDVSTESVRRNGLVKAVQCHDYVGNDYTIHMEFENELSLEEFYQAVGRKR